MEFIFSAVIGFIFLVFLVGSFFIRNTSVAADVLRPQGFPLIFSIIGLILLGIDTIGTIHKKKDKNAAKIQEDVMIFNKKGYKRTGLVVLLLFLYIVLLNITGFVFTTLLFVFISVWVIGYKRWKVLALFSFLMTAILVIFFGRIFFIVLPRGSGIFRNLSYFLY